MNNNSLPGSSPEHKKHTPKWEPSAGQPEQPKRAEQPKRTNKPEQTPRMLDTFWGFSVSGDPLIQVVTVNPEDRLEHEVVAVLSAQDAMNYAVNLMTKAIQADMYADLARMFQTQGHDPKEAHDMARAFAHFQYMLLQQNIAMARAAARRGNELSQEPGAAEGEGV